MSKTTHPRIKITHAPPVGTEHGITLGRVFQSLGTGTRRGSALVEGDTGEPVTILSSEYDVTEEPVTPKAAS